jgi:hypothetical protein
LSFVPSFAASPLVIAAASFGGFGQLDGAGQKGVDHSPGLFGEIGTSVQFLAFKGAVLLERIESTEYLLESAINSMEPFVNFSLHESSREAEETPANQWMIG